MLCASLSRVLGIACAMFFVSQSYAQINDLVKTPPMGWNSWNVFHENINEKQIKEIADIMVNSGMKDAGYIYLNLDDNWMAKKRDANGNLTHDPDRFPSGMKALGDYIHSKGLKFGVYGDRGLRTCHHYNNSAQFPNSESGSYMKEERDAKTFASWGVDYLKYDNCEPAAGSNQQQDYERMRDALKKSGRDIVFSICAWGFQKWMPQTGNLWRTTGDIGNAWKNAPGDWFRGVADIIEEQENLYSYAGPGHWNDPDMLQVGNGKLSDDEARSQMTMWAVMAAPLLTGNDIRNMSATTKEIYLNAEMIAVDQDSAGIAGHRVKKDGEKQIWMRPLGGEGSGKLAVVLYNTGDGLTTIDLNFADVGVSGEVMVHDIWKKKDLGLMSNGLSAEVPSHGVAFLILSSKVVPQEPFGGFDATGAAIAGNAIPVPGKIEVENYDLGSAGLAYSDKDSENKGEAYRNDGVDIVEIDRKDEGFKGYAVGYTESGEWIEYTVAVKKTTTYKITANVASGSETSSFMLYLDGERLVDSVKVPKTDDAWSEYKEIDVVSTQMTSGEHALKLLITGSYVNIDWLLFTDPADTTSIRLVQKQNAMQKKGEIGMRFDGQKLFVQNGEKRFDLKGKQIR